MRLKRRQYVLILLILAVGSFNLYRMKKAQREQQHVSPQLTIAPGTSPAWPVYDQAAAVRDAADPQFQPALKALNQAIDNTNAVAIPPQASSGELADLHGCQTWLLFYRQEHLHPSNKPGWKDQLQRHVDSCVAHHRDIAQ